jgi:hypothetical protein
VAGAVVEYHGCCDKEYQTACGRLPQSDARKQHKDENLSGEHSRQYGISLFDVHFALDVTRRYRVAQMEANGRRTRCVPPVPVRESTRPIGTFGGNVAELVDVTMMSPA